MLLCVVLSQSRRFIKCAFFSSSMFQVKVKFCNVAAYMRIIVVHFDW